MKMKKKLLLMMGLFITLGTQAQINEKVYFTAEQMPDMMVFMPDLQTALLRLSHTM